MSTPQKYLADMESDLAKKQKECQELEKHIHEFRALLKNQAVTKPVTKPVVKAKPKIKATAKKSKAKS